MSFVFNTAKGKVNSYAELPDAGDTLIVVPIEATGLEADATLADYDFLSDLLAAANNEQTTMGRKTLASVTVAPDDTGDTQSAAFGADVVWTAPTGNPVGMLLVCYNPGGASADTAIVPLTGHTVSITPDGNDVTVSAATFFEAA